MKFELDKEKKEKMKKLASNVEMITGKLEEQYKSKLKDKLKGYEMALILFLITIAICGANPRGALLSCVIFGFMASPVWIKKVLKKDDTKKEDTVPKKTTKSKDKED